MLIHLMLNLLLKTAPGKSSALRIGKAIAWTKNTQWLSCLCTLICSIISWHSIFKNVVLLQVCDKDYLIMIHTEIDLILQHGQGLKFTGWSSVWGLQFVVSVVFLMVKKGKKLGQRCMCFTKSLLILFNVWSKVKK